MGYKPDWQNQSAKKPAGHKCSPGIQSRELFHGAKMANGGMVKGYADGGMPEPLREPTEADRGETSVADLPELREPTAADRGEAPAAPQKFGDAFKSARAGGAKEFEWNGKKYTTQLASETKASTKPAVKDDRNEMDKQSDAAASRNYRNEMDKQSDKASAPAPAAKPTYTTRGRGSVSIDKEPEKKKFSRFSSGGKYVPSTGVVVDKK